MTAPYKPLEGPTEVGFTAAPINLAPGYMPVTGLDLREQRALDDCLQQLSIKSSRNILRSQYYDAKTLFKDLGISTPPKFRNFEAVLGWPAKAVDSLSRRCSLDGFVIAGQSTEDLGVDWIWDDNSMEVEAPQAHDSAFIHSCAFVTTIKGDQEAGEPEILMLVRDAFNSTGVWNPRKRGFDASISVIERDDNGNPMYVVLYLPEQAILLRRTVVGGRWSVDRRRNVIGKVPVEPLVYRPRLGRPFGRSRISRPIMYITDAAVRCVVRSEIGAEFFTAPQRYGLNIPEEAFETGGWNAILGRFLNIGPPDPDEEVDPNFAPQVGQFPQMTMQPHTEQLRQWATLFAGESAIPVSSLGIVQDNPSSAEALYASKEELVIEAEYADRIFGVGWERSMRNALMLRDGLSEIRPEWRKLRSKWRDPATPSRSSAADAAAKDVATFPGLAESEVALERAGYDRGQIERIMADRRRSTTRTAMERLLSSPEPPVPTTENRPVVDDSINLSGL